MAYKLVPISLEEYRVLFDAGVWVFAHHGPAEGWALMCVSDTRFPDWRDEEWGYCYTRIECDE